MSNPVRILRPDDPRIAAYAGVRERDLTSGAEGRFIVEGRVTLNILLTRSRFEIESLLLADHRLEPLAALLQTVPPDVPIYTADQDVMDKIAGFPIHRGILACARKGKAVSLGELIERPPNAGKDAAAEHSTLLILNQISNHDNVGAAFRNAAAFGARGVILDEQSCDPLYRKSIRVSAGTALWMPFYHGGSGEDHITALKLAGYTIWALTPASAATPLYKAPVPNRLAILLGAEGPGLPASLIKAATPIQIPMIPDFDSINVATAGAIALAQAYAAREGR